MGILMSHNPEMLQRLRSACSAYRAETLTLEELQSLVYQAMDAVTAFDERELRKLLQRTEGEIELVLFTVNEVRVREAALEVVTRLEQTINQWEPPIESGDEG